MVNKPLSEPLFKKNWGYVFVLPFLICLFYSFERNKTHADQSIVHFKEINRKIDTISKTDEKLRFEIIFDSSELFLDIDLETELVILTAWKQSVKTDFNYTYDTELESSLEEIKILKSNLNNDLIVLLPTFTEEFLTCQVIKVVKDSGTFKTGLFEINTHRYDNISGFYLKNEMELTQHNDHFEITLGDFKYEQDFSEVEN